VELSGFCGGRGIASQLLRDVREKNGENIDHVVPEISLPSDERAISSVDRRRTSAV
jgi:hypothetical protein